ARFLNVLLGVWLFISAFGWTHAPAEFANTWICGVLCVVFALIAVGYGPARYLNTALAIWLFISGWALPSPNAGTVWNNVLVAIAVFLLSLVPGLEEARRPIAYPAEPRRTEGHEIRP